MFYPGLEREPGTDAVVCLPRVLALCVSLAEVEGGHGALEAAGATHLDYGLGDEVSSNEALNQ